MNIFVLAYDPRVAAQYHCDKHVVKMVLETAQILSTVVRTHVPAARNGKLYKAAFHHHPCVLWAASSVIAFRWLYRLGVELACEYEYRYGEDRTHKSADVIFEAGSWESYIPVGSWQPFAKAMPDGYRKRCPVASYRQYYRHGKAHLHQWTRRPVPRWL